MAPSEESRPEFKRRLQRYCVDEREFPAEPLVTPCRSVVMLSASSKDSSYRPARMLYTQDLDELKRWIGVPDQVVRGRTFIDNEQRREMQTVCRCHDQVKRGQAGARDLIGMVRTQESPSKKFDAIRAHARTYLYGDSSLVKDSKAAIEGVFGSFQVPMWIFPKITVTSGSVLAFGPGSNVLLASELEIEQGGQVLSYGTLTVNVGNLRKTQPLTLVQAIDVGLLAKAYFTR